MNNDPEAQVKKRYFQNYMKHCGSNTRRIIHHFDNRNDIIVQLNNFPAEGRVFMQYVYLFAITLLFSKEKSSEEWVIPVVVVLVLLLLVAVGVIIGVFIYHRRKTEDTYTDMVIPHNLQQTDYAYPAGTRVSDSPSSQTSYISCKGIQIGELVNIIQHLEETNTCR